MKRSMATLAVAALLLSSCGPAPTGQGAHNQRPKVTSKKIYHFQDGRSGYQGDDGLWWYFIANQSDGTAPTSGYRGSATAPPTTGSGASSVTGSSASTSVASAASTASARGGFGSMGQTYGTGGVWSRGPAPTETEKNEAQVTEEEVAQGPEGEPLTSEEAQAAESQAEAAEASEATSSEASSESSSTSESSSSSSDSGSSGDSGGGGGDGGGGGGGGD